MNSKSPTQYHNGLIDIFKLHKVIDLNVVNIKKKGEIAAEMDSRIGRRVIKLSGLISASNYLEIPNKDYSKSLNYSGKYYYIYYKGQLDRKFSIMFTFVCNDIPIRINMKHPLSQPRFSKTNSYNLDIPFLPDEDWCLFRFDPIGYINMFFRKEFSGIGSVTSENLSLRDITIWSSIIMKGIYITNTLYSRDNIPKEIIAIRQNDDVKLRYMEVPESEEIIQEDLEEENDVVSITPKRTYTKKMFQENFDEPLNEIEKRSKELYNETIKKSAESPAKTQMRKLERELRNIESHKQSIPKSSLDLKEANSEILKKNMESINKQFDKKEIIRDILKKDDQRRKPLLPDPIMNLKFVLGFTATCCPIVMFDQLSQVKKHIIFPSGTNQVKFDPEEIKQKFFFGHSKPITNYVFACDGQIMFSCQEGKNAIIRIWKTEQHRCIKMLTTPYEKIKALSVSKDNKLLCTVGLEGFNKELIILWDIHDIDNIKVIIRQSSHFSINCIKFSPFNGDVMVSCGKENIKFWRIKKEPKEPHLNGKAVVLDKYSRDNHFLCLDFENPLLTENKKGKVFIGSSQGCVFQISCDTMELEAVYKVQDSGILSITVNDAFCVTGSLDGYLRVWPIDFSEFLIEAKHDSGVCSVDIAYDALDIVCGTLNGSIGILNIQNKEYRTILRSPPNKVINMKAHPSGSFIFTIEDDKSVRVWNVDNKSEAFQFVSAKDAPTALGAPMKNIFACGFSSGVLKIFDLENIAILYESKSFNLPITQIEFIQSDAYLISMNSQGHLSIHDTYNNFMQIKSIRIDEPTPFTDISLTHDKEYFATIGPEANCVLVWNSKTFGLKNRIPVNNFFIKRLCLMTKNILAVVLENCSIQFYSIGSYEGLLIKEFPNIHIDKVNELLISKNYKYLMTSGEEGMIKIWDSKMLYRNYMSYQQYIGHSTGVRALIVLEQKSLIITASDNSGIFFWNFLGDLTFCETEITQEFEKLGKLKEIPNKKQINTMSTIKANSSDKNYRGNEIRVEKRLKINFDITDLNAHDLNMLPVNVDDDITLDLSNSMTTEMIKRGNASMQDLINKIYFSPNFIPATFDINNGTINNNTKLSKQFCIGFNTNTISNLIYNKDNRWFVYTINNKIIIEFLEENRSQIVLESHLDEISCLTMSPDGKYLVSGSGLANKEETAPICIWDIQTWNLKKKLPFHYKGIQCIKFSQNGKYMISAGTKEENSICVWNFSNFSVIDSKSLKFCVIDLVTDKLNDNNLYFSTISTEVVSFWRLDTNNRLDGFHIKYEDITNERETGEVLTAIEISPFVQQLQTSFLLIGTNTGALIIMEKEKKIILKKYYISKCAITRISINKDTLLCSGESPVILCWRYNFEKMDTKHFDFIENERSKILFVDNNITSISFIQQEGLIGTDSGSIYYASFAQNTSIKILSSHRFNINSLDSCNDFILSGGDDGTVRAWTPDSFDQKFQFMKINEKCENVYFNKNDNVAVALYESSVRVFNLSTLKSLGQIKIPENDINIASYIFNNQGLFVSTTQDKLFVLFIQNWDPISVLFTEIDNSFIPVNQMSKYIDSKNLSIAKSLVTMSFSDGTVIVISVEKLDGKVDIAIIDRFNMFEYHISKSDDVITAELFKNLTKFRTNYISQVNFSKKYDDHLFCFHECLQFLYIRNYNTNEVYRRIPLNYFPSAISISEKENYIAVGTREGLILFITRIDNSVNAGYNLDTFSGHYDFVKCLKFDGNRLLSSSYSELFVWNIN